MIGVVQADGRIKVDNHLQPGQVVKVLLVLDEENIETNSIRLEEARLAAEPTEEQWAEHDRLMKNLAEIGGKDLGLPKDYSDEIDHYLYGTPKRGDE